jgi:hypothetical protein
VSYRPKYFQLHELVPPDIYEARGARAWELLDERALITLDALREHLGPFIVNDWWWDGKFKESGLRSLTTKTGAALSQHRFGRAFDCKFRNKSPKEACDYVLSNQDQFPHLTVIENTDSTPTWFHFDVRSHDRTGIWMVNP